MARKASNVQAGRELDGWKTRVSIERKRSWTEAICVVCRHSVVSIRMMKWYLSHARCPGGWWEKVKKSALWEAARFRG